MRIIAGKYRGRTLDPPRTLKARPTTDFAKENLFNILASQVDFETCNVLDLFAGTGSISYEFASRGMAEPDYSGSVTAIEMNPTHVRFIADTAKKLGFERFSVVRANVFLYLKACQRRFDVIFSDAPYDLPGSEQVIDQIFGRNLLEPEGLLIFEHPKGQVFAQHPNFRELRSYGSVQFSIFEAQ